MHHLTQSSALIAHWLLNSGSWILITFIFSAVGRKDDWGKNALEAFLRRAMSLQEKFSAYLLRTFMSIRDRAIFTKNQETRRDVAVRSVCQRFQAAAGLMHCEMHNARWYELSKLSETNLPVFAISKLFCRGKHLKIISDSTVPEIRM